MLAGGICWDAASCAAHGDMRTISLDSLHSVNPDHAPAVPYEIKMDVGAFVCYLGL